MFLKDTVMRVVTPALGPLLQLFPLPGRLLFQMYAWQTPTLSKSLLSGPTLTTLVDIIAYSPGLVPSLLNSILFTVVLLTHLIMPLFIDCGCLVFITRKA